jgi:energy-coupling factor transporter transmembrane protein EcfT
MLHKLDARIKLVALLAISLSSLAAGGMALAMASLVVAGLFLQTRISLHALVTEIRYFLFFIAIIFIARAITTPGDPILPALQLKFSIQGIFSGGLMCWRLLIVVLLGLMWTATTSPALIRQSIQWLLRPIPGLSHQKIGTMIGLLIRFIPLIFLTIHDISDAQRARAIDLRKNPFYRMTKLTMGALRNIFVTADQLALAMEARCYQVNHTPLEWNTNAFDWVAFSVALLLCCLMFIV